MGGISGVGEMEMGSSSHGILGSNFSPFSGLNFGEKVYFEGVGDGDGDDGGGSSPKGPTAPASLPPGAAKKGQQRPRCQVEGCQVDLSGAKGYYSRHKVCVMHSKSPKVIVAGLEQRFCQQCSRFQKLHEFDQGKRSCRRRLADHNERRRKPPIGSLSSHIGRLSSSFHVNDSRLRGFLLDFTQPWTLGASKDELPTTGSANLQASVHRGSHPYMQSPICGNQFSTARNTRGERLEAASDSGCALSLLSVHPWGKTVARNGKPGLAPSISSYGSPEAQPVATSSCMINSWGFKGRQGGVLSSEVQTEMGFGSGSARFSGELELALQKSRGCTDLEPGRECRPFDDAVDWSL